MTIKFTINSRIYGEMHFECDSSGTPSPMRVTCEPFGLSNHVVYVGGNTSGNPEDTCFTSPPLLMTHATRWLAQHHRKTKKASP